MTWLAEPEWSQLKTVSKNIVREIWFLWEWIMLTDWITPLLLSCCQRPCRTIVFRTRRFIFSLPRLAVIRREQQVSPTSLSAPLPLSLSLMVFWFQFPISSLSQFDKVTSRCHLQYPTPFTGARWNAIINMKYSPDRLQLFQRGETSMFTVQKSSPSRRCQPLSVFSGDEKKIIQQGLVIPCLFVELLQSSKTRLSQSMLTIWTSRWNDKCQYIFI